MNDSFSFSLPGLGRSRPLWLEEMETVLELMPHAALLVEQPEGRVVLANQRLAELSSYTRAELTGLNAATLFPDWKADTGEENLPLPLSSPGPGTRGTLARRSKAHLPVSITHLWLAGQRCLVLAVVTPVDPPFATRTGDLRLDSNWEKLSGMADVFQAPSFDQAVTRLLEAGQVLTGAQYLAVYRLQADSPTLACCAMLNAGPPPVMPAKAAEPAPVLPAQLTTQELMQLNTPRLWEASRRPQSSLHRAARSAGLTCLASAPIGQGRAIVGLLAVGDRQENGLEPAASQYLQAAVHFLADALSALFQQHARLENLNEQLNRQAFQLKVLESVEENSREGQILVDAALNITRLNPAAELMLGYASQEVVGHPVEKVLIGPEDLLPALAAAQAGSPTHNLGATRLYRRNGDAFLALVRIYPVIAPGANQTAQRRPTLPLPHIPGAGYEAGILIFITDQSEQEQIQLHTQQLEHRALLGEVTAIFAHEVRNPINNISTGLQLMAMNLPGDDPNQENIARMLQDCDRLAELIRSVLAFSRPAEYEMERLDLPLLLRRLLDRLRPRIAKLNIQADLALPDECPPIQGNLRALEQVFSNLITNALQAMGENANPDHPRHLVVKVQPVSIEGHAFIEASVADTGPGIPKELQDKIFQPFFTTGHGGTGLGLAIAKRILTAHKGDIRLESFPGGTVFSVRFPVEN